MLLLAAQMRIRETRKAIMSEPTVNLKTNNADDGAEWEFWENLREICLLPEQAAFNQSGEFVVTFQIICVYRSSFHYTHAEIVDMLKGITNAESTKSGNYEDIHSKDFPFKEELDACASYFPKAGIFFYYLFNIDIQYKLVK